MAKNVVLRGADIKVYIGGKLDPEIQSISYTIDYGENPIYGIDCPFPQEISTTRITVNGNVTAIRVKDTGGIKGYNLRGNIKDSLGMPYVSLRIQDRHTNSDILFIPQIKVKNETFQAQTKTVVKVSFSFSGMVPFTKEDFEN